MTNDKIIATSDINKICIFLQTIMIKCTIKLFYAASGSKPISVSFFHQGRACSFFFKFRLISLLHAIMDFDYLILLFCKMK